MAATTGTKIVKDGLVLNIDAANVGKNAGLTSVEYLIVAGGGGGSNGGAGAGGLLTGITTIIPQVYTITVGAGGAGAPSFQPSRPDASDGTNSVAFGLTAVGGGGGGAVGKVGRNGGSGGGGGADSATLRVGGTGITGQGNAGGINSTNRGSPYPTGGGGGAGAPGDDGTGTSSPGAGGNGININISGTSTFYAGGGGGSLYSSSVGAPGGAGGGGAGGTTGVGQPGTPNTGGGAGGTRGDITGGPGPSGGSGIVIIRYPGPQRAVGGTVTQVGTDTIHTYTTVGNSTFTPLTYANNTAFAAVPDLSTSRTLATTVNGPVYNSDFGGNIVVDGIDDYILIGPVSGTGTSTSSVSWNIWVYATGTSGNIMSMSIANPQGSWNMPPIIASGQRFAGKIWSNTRLTSFIYTLNVWYQVTLVWDANQNSQFFYVNGELQGFQSAISYSASGADNFLFLGQTNPGADNTGMFAGKYGTFQVYNKALSQQEVQQNFEATRGRYGI